MQGGGGTFRSATIEKMPRKLTVMRKLIIQPNAGFFTSWFPRISMTGAPDVAEVLTTWSCIFWSIPNKYDPNPPVNNKNTMQIPQNKNPISRVGRRSDDHNLTKSEEQKKPQHSGGGEKNHRCQMGGGSSSGRMLSPHYWRQGHSRKQHKFGWQCSPGMWREYSRCHIWKELWSTSWWGRIPTTRWDVQGRNDTHCEIQLVGDDAE